MHMETDHLAADLEFVKALAVEAAEMALDRAGRVTPREKANRSLVTDLDRDLEQFFRGRLAARFPDDQLTGEEYATAGGTGPRRWSIDPIDGTGNLVHGLPSWAISIGLLDAGRPVLGVIAVPPRHELFWAIAGGGAWKDGTRIEAAPDADAFHPQDNVGIGTSALRVLDPRTVPGRLRVPGSACCELVDTAMGRLTADIVLDVHAHDVAAGAVIAAEAGCAIGTVDGRRLTPAEFVAETPTQVPTILAPPRRLAALVAQVRRFS